MVDAATGQARGDPALSKRFATWAFAVVAVIVMPLLPLLVEMSKHNFVVQPDNLFLTAAVLAVGFGFSSESDLFRAAYTLIFFFSVGLDYHITDKPDNTAVAAIVPAAGITDSPAPASSSLLFDHPGFFILAVCVIHAVERLSWHVGEKKKFPDFLNKGESA
jgi:hypothetical protein